MSTENRLEVQAQRKHVGHPAQKVRLVVNQVRGMRAEEALITLDFMTQAAAKEVYKVVASALANAEQNEMCIRDSCLLRGVQREEIERGQVDVYKRQGKTRTRWRMPTAPSPTIAGAVLAK